MAGAALNLPGNVLVDCPAAEFQDWCQAQGGIQYLLLTQRDGADRVERWQQRFQCPVYTQQYEAYLYPGVWVRPFAATAEVAPGLNLIWTPGYSPGSSCIYLERLGGVLFTGRHLLPDSQGELRLYRTRKTFHWPRQQRSLETLRNWLGARPVQYICPGAHTGFLRGRGYLAVNSPTDWYDQVRERLMTGVPQVR
ncbi:MAG: hypothetical protein NZL92_00695 [Gloeomargarita sp. SKYG116]|nr:hypothetical protein [Gloeomargarita sp. SKYG116]MCS7293003.1 hypothetical protein [Gloeomargarita sp. SKYB120]MDW8178568.1 hypothetical protein [Gloeomargarita sp. SKYBB_i_bin120]MDW8400194.1 hypothetical protein [Gloeomargarita sp. SKYGB_i_bin116]